MWDWWEEHSAALRMQARCGLRELARKSDSKFAQKKTSGIIAVGFWLPPLESAFRLGSRGGSGVWILP